MSTTNNTATLTASAQLQALTVAIRALALPLAAGGADAADVAATGLHIANLASLAQQTAEGLLDAT